MYEVPKHYDFPIQPYDYISQNKLGWPAGNVIKYATRAGLKVNKGEEPIDAEIRDWEKIVKYAQLHLRDLRLKKADARENDINDFEPVASVTNLKTRWKCPDGCINCLDKTMHNRMARIYNKSFCDCTNLI